MCLPRCLRDFAVRFSRRSSQPSRGGRRASVAGRLIEDAVGRHGLDEGGSICRLGDFESIEAGAIEEKELVAQYLAGCAQLASKMIALAQDTSLRIGAAIAEIRKHQCHERHAIKVRRK